MKNISSKKRKGFTLISKKTRGFTLIELIVVIAIIGILVLLAMPKFMEYTKEAKMAQIKHDVKVAETVMDEYLSTKSKLPNDLDALDMNTPLAEGRLFEIRGEATAIIGDTDGYRDVTTMVEVQSISSKLPGQFVANENGNVYYIHTKAIDIGETLPDLTIAEDQAYMDESVPTLASVWGEDAKEVMAMVTALDGVGVSAPTQDDAWNLYQDLKVADPELLNSMISVQPQIWTGNYSEVTGDLNSIKNGANTWLTGLFGTLTEGNNNYSENNMQIGDFVFTPEFKVSGSDKWLYVHYTFDGTLQNSYTTYTYATSTYTNEKIVNVFKGTSTYYVNFTINYDWLGGNYNKTVSMFCPAAWLGMGTATELYDNGRYIDIGINLTSPLLDDGWDAETDRRYPEAPWLGAYSNTWQDVKMAKSGNKDIYLGTIDRYINDIVNVLTWDNIDVSSVSYYGGGSATTTLKVTSDGLLEVTVPE